MEDISYSDLLKSHYKLMIITPVNQALDLASLCDSFKAWKVIDLKAW